MKSTTCESAHAGAQYAIVEVSQFRLAEPQDDDREYDRRRRSH
jgi:hypothetical protein